MVSDSTTKAYFEGAMSADFSLSIDCRMKAAWVAADNAALKYTAERESLG